MRRILTFSRQGSGIPYPIPWKLLPLNIYLRLRFTIAYLMDQEAKSRRAYYQTKGIQNRDHFLTIRKVPWVTMTIPEAGLPLVVPKEVFECGPIVLDVAKVEDESPELHDWLSRAPTVLINLGSLMKYDETRAEVMAQAIYRVLKATSVQILWKFTKLGDYGDEFLQPLQHFKDIHRVRFSTWLEVEPISLLQSGRIVLSVHHGGANSYHEAI